MYGPSEFYISEPQQFYFMVFFNIYIGQNYFKTSLLIQFKKYLNMFNITKNYLA